MSDATAEKRVEGIWSGCGQGTNRGKILVRIRRSANGLTAKAILYDEQLGITEASLSGLTSRDKTEFRLVEVRGLARGGREMDGPFSSSERLAGRTGRA